MPASRGSSAARMPTHAPSERAPISSSPCVPQVKYPSVDLSYNAGRAGGTMTGVLSAANEQAVAMFIDEKIGYLDITKVIEKTCERHRAELVAEPSLEDIVGYDNWARKYAEEVAGMMAPVVAR